MSYHLYSYFNSLWREVDLLAGHGEQYALTKFYRDENLLVKIECVELFTHSFYNSLFEKYSRIIVVLGLIDFLRRIYIRLTK